MFKFFKNNNKKEAEKPEQKILVEGRDFYIENGNYVFTEYYLKNRGYCCENRCRHCPYGIHEKDRNNS